MRTLLAVDDNESVLAVLDLLLSPQGYSIVRAASGTRALALATETQIDGAIIDIHMPVMNGFEVCRVLRERATAGGHDLPVWLITGAYSREAVERAKQVGALDVFQKPFDFAAVLLALESGFNRPPAKTGPAS